MSLYDEIKNKVITKEVAEHYELKVKRNKEDKESNSVQKKLRKGFIIQGIHCFDTCVG